MKFDLLKFDKGTILLSLCAVIGGVFMLGQEIKKYNKAPAIDEVARFESKLMSVKNKLPHNETIGYVTDLTSTDPFNNSVDMEYYLAQYVLSPIIVNRGENYQYTLGVYYKDTYTTLKNLSIIYQEKIDNRMIVLYKRSR